MSTYDNWLEDEDTNEDQELFTLLKIKSKKTQTLSFEDMKIRGEQRRKEKIRKILDGKQHYKVNELYAHLMNDTYTRDTEQPQDIALDAFGSNALSICLKRLPDAPASFLPLFYEVLEACPNPFALNKLGERALDVVTDMEILFLLYQHTKKRTDIFNKDPFRLHYAKLKQNRLNGSNGLSEIK